MALKDFIQKNNVFTRTNRDNADQDSVLENSLSKSSNLFKMYQSQGQPAPVTPPPGPSQKNVAPEARADLQGFDYFNNLYQNATDPKMREAARGWIERNTINDLEQPTDDFSSTGPDFSSDPYGTSTSNVAYSMEKLNELYGTKSPEDLWALRQQLRRDESSARAGMLPEEEYMRFSGDGVTDGAPRYNYADRTAVNRATADIFGTQVADLDKFMNDFAKGETESASSGGYSFGSNPALDVILGSGKFTKDQKGLIIGAIQSGQDPSTVILNQARSLMPNTISTEVSKTQQGLTQLKEVQSALAEYYANGGKTSLLRGGYEKVLQKLGKTNDPKLAIINARIAKALQKYRNAVSGTAYSVQEGADIASIFPGIKKGKELNDALLNAGIQSLEDDIDTAYGEVLGVDIYNSLKTGGSNQPSQSSGWKKNPDGTWSFSKVGGGTNKAISGIDDVLMRIARNEGTGSYSQLGPVVTQGQYRGQRALGRYQVMPGNVPAWTKEALGYSMTPQQFLNNPQAQEAVARDQMMKAYRKYGNWNDVASVWFTGRPLAQGYKAKDVLGTTGAEYVRNFNS